MKVKQYVLIGRVTWGSTFSQVARKHSLIQIESQDINKGHYLWGGRRANGSLGVLEVREDWGVNRLSSCILLQCLNILPCVWIKLSFKKANLKIYVKHRQLGKYIRIQGACQAIYSQGSRVIFKMMNRREKNKPFLAPVQVNDSLQPEIGSSRLSPEELSEESMLENNLHMELSPCFHMDL